MRFSASYGSLEIMAMEDLSVFGNKVERFRHQNYLRTHSLDGYMGSLMQAISEALDDRL
jgi:hypothetical protein